jgi:hypothetical protein
MFTSLRARFIASHVLPLLIVLPIMGIALIYIVETQVLLDSAARETVAQAAAGRRRGASPRAWGWACRSRVNWWRRTAAGWNWRALLARAATSSYACPSRQRAADAARRYPHGASPCGTARSLKANLISVSGVVKDRAGYLLYADGGCAVQKPGVCIPLAFAGPRDDLLTGVLVVAAFVLGIFLTYSLLILIDK